MSTYVKVPTNPDELAAANEFLQHHGVAMIFVRHTKCPGWRSYPNTGKPWTQVMDRELQACFYFGFGLTELCKKFGRPPGGIVSRLSRMGFITYDNGKKWRGAGYYRTLDGTRFAHAEEYYRLHKGN